MTQQTLILEVKIVVFAKIPPTLYTVQQLACFVETDTLQVTKHAILEISQAVFLIVLDN